MTLPDILLIQEKKFEEKDFLDPSIHLCNKEKILVLNSRGTSGGIKTLWDDTKIDMLLSQSTKHWILTQFLHKYSGKMVSLFNVYVSMALEDNKDWTSL